MTDNPPSPAELRKQIVDVLAQDRPDTLLARASADGLRMKFNSMVPPELQIEPTGVGDDDR